MATKTEQIDSARAAALAEEIAAAASGKVNFDAGSLLQKIQDRPDVEQRVASDAEDYVTVYDNRTGISSTIPIYMLARVLRRRYSSENDVPVEWRNRPVFSVEQRVKPERGQYMCWFHDDSPHREEMTLLGYGRVHCTKTGIPTEVDAENHVLHKHSNSYKGITRSRETRRADSQNSALLELLKALVDKEK